MKLNLKSTLYSISILFLCNILILGQKGDVIEIGNIYPGEVESSAFKLSDESNVFIEGNAGNFGGSFSENLVFYAWIINSTNREVVWDSREEYDIDDSRGMFEIDSKEKFDPGTYEVYYACNNGYDGEINNFGDFMSRIFSGSKKNKFKRKYRSELGLTVFGEEGKFSEVDPTVIVNKLAKKAVVSINRVIDDEDSKKGFSLKDDTELRIYTIGEGRKDNVMDVAWITDVKTNKIVWRPNMRRSEHAGGGKKNYLVEDNIVLPAGSYLLHYSSDDSHSYESWNVMPPNDPQFWGATIWPISEKDRRNVIPFKEEDIVNPMVELIKVGDDEYRSQGFTLPSRTELRVLCLGEGYDVNDLADIGWIINADTKKVVWTMNDNNNIEHAGGSKKNLMVDEKLVLDKGNYIASYSSDDSHSYEEWNASNPFDKVRWGLTIWSDQESYKLFNADSYRSENVLAEIIRVRDDEELYESFNLSKDSRVRIVAIGEGSRSGMDDYGWIEDSDGDIVWEMTYRKTKEAGGASKNRLFNKTISLKSGKYKLHYVSDDSHSYNSWNSSPPSNQDSYGITVLLEK